MTKRNRGSGDDNDTCFGYPGHPSPTHHSRPQRQHSFWPALRITTSGQVQHLKSAIQGLSVIRHMLGAWLAAHSQKIRPLQRTRFLETTKGARPLGKRMHPSSTEQLPTSGVQRHCEREGPKSIRGSSPRQFLPKQLKNDLTTTIKGCLWRIVSPTHYSHTQAKARADSFLTFQDVIMNSLIFFFSIRPYVFNHAKVI